MIEAGDTEPSTSAATAGPSARITRHPYSNHAWNHRYQYDHLLVILTRCPLSAACIAEQLSVGRSERMRSTPRPASFGRWGGPASRSQERPVSPRKPSTPLLFYLVTCAPRRAQQTRHAMTQSYWLRATHHRPIRGRRVVRLIKLREEKAPPSSSSNVYSVLVTCAPRRAQRTRRAVIQRCDHMRLTTCQVKRDRSPVHASTKSTVTISVVPLPHSALAICASRESTTDAPRCDSTTRTHATHHWTRKNLPSEKK